MNAFLPPLLHALGRVSSCLTSSAALGQRVGIFAPSLHYETKVLVLDLVSTGCGRAEVIPVPLIVEANSSCEYLRAVCFVLARNGHGNRRASWTPVAAIEGQNIQHS